MKVKVKGSLFNKSIKYPVREGDHFFKMGKTSIYFGKYLIIDGTRRDMPWGNISIGDADNFEIGFNPFLMKFDKFKQSLKYEFSISAKRQGFNPAAPIYKKTDNFGMCTLMLMDSAEA
jgi:hypothetical protein